MSGLWVSENKFVSFGEMSGKKSLSNEIASRQSAWDFSGLIGLLPDPDPVLAKRGDGAEILDGLTSDGHLISVIQTRKLGTLKREYKWDPGCKEGSKPSPTSQKLCEQFAEDLKNIKLYDLISAILDAPLFGFTPIEILWQPRKDHIAIQNLRPLPHRWFGYDEDNNPKFISLNNQWEGESLPWGKFVFANHFPTYDNPFGLRLLSRCFWPVVFKRGGLKFWITLAEKYGMPFLLGKYAQGTPEPEQQDMLTKLEKMVKDAVAVVPDGSTVEMIGGGSQSTGSALIHKQLKEAMDAEMSKVIMGQTLTAEIGNKGSYSASKTHENVLELYQESDQKLVKATLEEIARIYTLINDPSADQPIFTWFEVEDPQKDFADRDKTLIEGGRVRLTREYYIRRYGFHEDDFEIIDDPKTLAPQHEGFSEPLQDTDDRVAQVLACQNRLDQLADQKTSQGISIFKPYIDRITAFLKEAESFESAVGDLLALSNDFDLTPWADHIAYALMESHRLGSDSEKLEFAETLWGEGTPFKEAIDYFRNKSFTIAGVSVEDLLESIKIKLVEAMESGSDINTFKSTIKDLFAGYGVEQLSSNRINLIYRTNMQTAFQGGRYSQMTSTHNKKRRPYWRYVAVLDGSTRPAHAAMHGKVFRNDNPIWQTWYPPNGFNCRCQVVSYSEREIERDDVKVETKDLTGTAVEKLDQATGELKKIFLIPDEGWGTKP